MKSIITILLLCHSLMVSAVNVNHQGMAEVAIVPYYTVNNDLNTLVSVTNSTSEYKAIKITFREGLNGYAVLSYNVYLSAFDTWTFALVATTSTIPETSGDDSVLLVSADTSCAPFLVKSGQEFLPYALIDGPQDMSRSREGYIEIIEMGELQGEFITAADHGSVGVPADCGEFASAWSVGGLWEQESGGDASVDMAPVAGGLMVQADIINVAEGINFSIPVQSLDGFFAAGSITHTSPGDIDLSLDAAAPQALMIANNKTYNLSFENGIDAVSAVLMADSLFGTYALDTIVAGRSETAYSQPTRRFYLNDELTAGLPPFLDDIKDNVCSSFEYGGTSYGISIWDRESQRDILFKRNAAKLSPRPPDLPPAAFCGSVFVNAFRLPGQAFDAPSITASQNYSNITTPSSAFTENGFIFTSFIDFSTGLVGADVNSGNDVQVMGIPIIGTTFTQFTNAGAAEGLLAQYGAAYQVNSQTNVIELDEVNN